MHPTNPRVDEFLNRSQPWRKEFEALRPIILDCDLTEQLKWGVPCYTLHGKNIVLIHGFKEYCAILFVKGALLTDTAGILITQTQNVQSARQVRFTDVDQIIELAPILRSYIQEAIELELAGKKVEFKPTTDYKIPAEFQKQLDSSSELRTAFQELTPGRQRAYLLHFTAPKLTKTRETRIAQSIPQILDGKGLNDH